VTGGGEQNGEEDEVFHQQRVIPGRRFSAGPGIQTRIRRVALDSGFAASRRSGMTE